MVSFYWNIKFLDNYLYGDAQLKVFQFTILTSKRDHRIVWAKLTAERKGFYLNAWHQPTSLLCLNFFSFDIFKAIWLLTAKNKYRCHLPWLKGENDECSSLPVMWFPSSDGVFGPLTGFTEWCLSLLLSRRANATRAQRKQFSYQKAKTTGKKQFTAHQRRSCKYCKTHKQETEKDVTVSTQVCIIFTSTDFDRDWMLN